MKFFSLFYELFLNFRILKSSKEKDKTSARSKSLITLKNAGNKILSLATEKMKKARK